MEKRTPAGEPAGEGQGKALGLRRARFRGGQPVAPCLRRVRVPTGRADTDKPVLVVSLELPHFATKGAAFTSMSAIGTLLEQEGVGQS